MYTPPEEKSRALKGHDDLRCVELTVRRLGYPSRERLRCWVAERGAPGKPRRPGSPC